MDIHQHILHTRNAIGVDAEDIHKWIDGYFDGESFREFIESKSKPESYNPYDHRRHRHCAEALDEVIAEFKSSYTEETIKKVFYMHLRDDYQGYLPSRSDFDNKAFLSKYHSPNSPKDATDEDNILGTDQLEQYFKNKKYSLHQKKIKNNYLFWMRILLPTTLPVLLFIFFIFGIIVPKIHTVMINDKKEMIQELAKAGISVIEYYIDQTEKDLLDIESAQAKAKQELSKMRYGIQSKDYYWIIDFHPRMLMHPYRPELIGTDLSQYRDHEDKSGKFLFKEAVELVKENGNGFLEYYWQWMDAPDTSALKMSYVEEIPKWKWILGTGVYINDIEDEMQTITEGLLQISLLILAVLFLFMVIIVFQGRNIEYKRQKAEAGLKEAKLRYRSLVESANEGYILIIEDTITFANKKIQQILDYNEKEFQQKQISELFVQEKEHSYYHINNLYNLCEKEPENFWLEIKLLSGSNRAIDSQIRVSKVFLPDSVAYLITIRDVQKFQNAIVLGEPTATSNSVEDIIREISLSKSIGHCQFSLQRLPAVILSSEKMDQQTRRKSIADIYDAVSQKMIELSTSELNKRFPNIPKNKKYSFLHLGSNARGEMTFFSDQDNALVFDTTGNIGMEKLLNSYYLEFSYKICSELKKSGFDYCPGGIQASNPQWCLSIESWKKKIDTWVNDYSKETMLEINVFADMNTQRLHSQLKTELKEYFMASVAAHPACIQALANSALEIRVPKLKPALKAQKLIETKQYINIKELLKIIETIIRLYTLKNGIEASETILRLHELNKKNIFRDDLYKNICSIFETLWDLRFQRQMAVYKGLGKIDDTIPLSNLDLQQRNILIDVINHLELLLSKAKLDFLGTVL